MEPKHEIEASKKAGACRDAIKALESGMSYEELYYNNPYWGRWRGRNLESITPHQKKAWEKAWIKLVREWNIDARMIIAESENTNPKMLHKLAKDKYDCVRFKVVRNPSTRLKTLELLAKDENRYVSGEATWRIEELSNI